MRCCYYTCWGCCRAPLRGRAPLEMANTAAVHCRCSCCYSARIGSFVESAFIAVCRFRPCDNHRRQLSAINTATTAFDSFDCFCRRAGRCRRPPSATRRTRCQYLEPTGSPAKREDTRRYSWHSCKDAAGMLPASDFTSMAVDCSADPPRSRYSPE